MSVYSDVFRESIFVSSFIPFIGDPTFFAMKGFGGYDMNLAVVLAVAGSAIGATVCFFTGRLLSKIFLKEGGKNNLGVEKYNRAARFFSKNIMVLMPLSFLPLLKFLPLFAGFLGQKAKIVLPLVVLGKAAYYGYHGLF